MDFLLHNNSSITNNNSSSITNNNSSSITKKRPSSKSSSSKRVSSKRRSSSKIITEKPKMNELDKKIILSMIERALKQVGHKKTILQNHSNIFYVLIKQAFRSNTFEKSFEYIFSAIVTYIQIIKIYNTRKESSKKNKRKTLKWNVREIQSKRKERAAKRGENTPEDIIEIPKGMNVEISLGGKRNITRKIIRSGGGKGWWESLFNALESPEPGTVSPFAFFTRMSIDSRNRKLKDYPKQLNMEKKREIEEAWEKGKKWDNKVEEFFSEVGKRDILKDINERVFQDDEFNSNIDGIFKLEDFSGLHISLLTQNEKIIFEYLIYLAYIKAYRPSDLENENKIKTLAFLNITTSLTEKLVSREDGPNISDLGEIMKSHSDVLDVLGDNDNDALNNSIPKGSKVILNEKVQAYNHMKEANDLLIKTFVESYIDSWCNNNHNDRNIWDKNGWNLQKILKQNRNNNICNEIEYEDKEEIKEKIIKKSDSFIEAMNQIYENFKEKREEDIVDDHAEVDLRGGSKTWYKEFQGNIENAKALVEFEKNHIYKTIEYNNKNKKYTLINRGDNKIELKSDKFTVIEYNGEFINLYKSQVKEINDVLTNDNYKQIQESLQAIGEDEENEEPEDGINQVSKGTITNYNSVINKIVNTEIIKFTPEELVQANQIAKRNYIRCIIDKASTDARYNYILKGNLKNSVIFRLNDIIKDFKNREDINKAINNLVSIEFTIYKAITMLMVSLFNPWILTGIAFLCGSIAMAEFLMQLISFIMILTTIYPEIYRFLIKCLNGGKGIELNSLIDVVKNMFNLYLITMMGHRLLTAGKMVACQKQNEGEVEQCISNVKANMGNPLTLQNIDHWHACDGGNDTSWFSATGGWTNPACLLKWILNALVYGLNMVTGVMEWVIINAINLLEGHGMSVFQAIMIFLNIYMYSIDEEVSIAYANVKGQIKERWEDEAFNIVDFNERLRNAADSGPPPKWNDIVDSEEGAGDAGNKAHQRIQEQVQQTMKSLSVAAQLQQTNLQGEQTNLQHQQLTAAEKQNEIHAEANKTNLENKENKSPRKMKL